MQFSELSPQAANIVAKFTLATTAEVVAGSRWYTESYAIARRIANLHDLSPVRVAAVIAALSPNNKWERNCLDAERLIQAYIHGDDNDAMAVSVCTYGAMKKKAVDILSTNEQAFPDEIVRILNGPKIIEFYNCIMQRNDVCIDGHAYSIWFGERMTMKQVPNIGKRLRERIKSDYIDATNWINLEMNTNYLPSDIQAIVWVCHKRIYKI